MRILGISLSLVNLRKTLMLYNQSDNIDDIVSVIY